MALTSKIDTKVLGGEAGAWPLGGGLDIAEEAASARGNLGDEMMIRGNTYVKVKFGVAVEHGDVVMFDELYGGLRSTAADNFAGNADNHYANGARKIDDTWTNGARTVKCGVVQYRDYAAGDVGWVMRRGTAVVKTRRDAETMEAETFATTLGADETAGRLSPHGSGAKFTGFRFNALTAATSANTDETHLMEICDPGGNLDTAAAAETQPDLEVDTGRPAWG